LDEIQPEEETEQVFLTDYRKYHDFHTKEAKC
jgi:hypothetical protein